MLINQNADAYSRKTDTYIVAYIDLLGITNKIKSTDQQLAMNILHNLYTFSINVTKEVQIEENKDIRFKIFSDNIIRAKKISSKTKQPKRDIRSLLMCAGHFQELAASDCVGWLMRGGISIGQLFIDDVMVWGEALLKSYYLEDKVANYPRIIIDRNVVNEILQDSKLSGYIRKDFDNLYFLNFLNDCHFCGEMLMNGFKNMQKEIGKDIDEKTYQKFCWHMNFVNSELDRKNEKRDRKYRLSLDLQLK